MPFLASTLEGNGGCSIYYELHGTLGAESPVDGNRPRVLLLMGFGATSHVWAPQLADLLVEQDDGGPPCVCCVCDNRGVGRSDHPRASRVELLLGPRRYSTAIMAEDGLRLLDHLGWGRVHLVGHSMGAMVAAKLAAMAPQRVASLSMLSATGGGWQAFPQSWRVLRLGIQSLFVRGARRKAEIDVQFHYSRSLLAELDPATRQPRKEMLIEEYVAAKTEERERVAELAAKPRTQHEADCGTTGQLVAVWHHRLRRAEVRSIQSGQFPIVVLHGSDDIIARPRYGLRLARRLQAPCIVLEGGHFVFREQAAAVNHLLRSLVLGQSFANVERYPFTPFHHWVCLLDEHRQRAERAQQGTPPPASRDTRELARADKSPPGTNGEVELSLADNFSPGTNGSHEPLMG